MDRELTLHAALENGWFQIDRIEERAALKERARIRRELLAEIGVSDKALRARTDPHKHGDHLAAHDQGAMGAYGHVHHLINRILPEEG